MKKNTAKSITLAGVGGTLSLLCIALAYYLGRATLSFYMLAAGGVMLPVSKGFFRAAALQVLAVSILGALFANIKVLPYALISGSLTLGTLFLDSKGWSFKPLAYIAKVGYALLVYAIFRSFLSIFSPQLLDILNSASDKIAYEIAVAVIFVCAVIVYDFAAIQAYRTLKVRIFDKIN